MATRSRYANGHARRKVRAWLKAQGGPCWLCGGAIDYSLPAGHPMSFEVDEIVPVSLGGDELDFANVQPAHRICNQRKGNRMGYTCESPGVAVAKSAGRGLLASSGDW